MNIPRRIGTEIRLRGSFPGFPVLCVIGPRQSGKTTLSHDCGISHNTAKAWLSVPESSGIVHLLRPYHRNFGERPIKSPKLHFLDSGRACRLLGISSPESTSRPL